MVDYKKQPGSGQMGNLIEMMMKITIFSRPVCAIMNKPVYTGIY
jgi:hypothetical protein